MEVFDSPLGCAVIDSPSPAGGRGVGARAFDGTSKVHGGILDPCGPTTDLETMAVGGVFRPRCGGSTASAASRAKDPSHKDGEVHGEGGQSSMKDTLKGMVVKEPRQTIIPPPDERLVRP